MGDGAKTAGQQLQQDVRDLQDRTRRLEVEATKLSDRVNYASHLDDRIAKLEKTVERERIVARRVRFFLLPAVGAVIVYILVRVGVIYVGGGGS